MSAALDRWRASFRDVVDSGLLTEAEADQLAPHRCLLESVELALREQARRQRKETQGNGWRTVGDAIARQLEEDDEIKRRMRVVGEDPEKLSFEQRKQRSLSLPLFVEQSSTDCSKSREAGFAGRSHAEVLALEFEDERQLIADLIPTGAVGFIAGVPETHKSWLAQAMAVGVARGSGEALGRQVISQGAVGYFS